MKYFAFFPFSSSIFFSNLPLPLRLFEDITSAGSHLPAELNCCVFYGSHASSRHNLLCPANQHPSPAARHPQKLHQSSHPYPAPGFTAVVCGVSFLHKQCFGLREGIHLIAFYTNLVILNNAINSASRLHCCVKSHTPSLIFALTGCN